MKVAIYARVSTDEQTTENQVAILEKWAESRQLEVHDVYCDVGSAWQHSDQKELRRLMVDCSRRKVDMVFIYDLSRLTRRGPLDMMLTLKKFADYKVQVNSYIDTWLNVPSEWQDVLIPLFGKFAELYSSQLSEKTKAGMARARAQGKHIGRPRKERITINPDDIKAQKKLESLKNRMKLLEKQMREISEEKGVDISVSE